jgi:hypothetical protein
MTLRAGVLTTAMVLGFGGSSAHAAGPASGSDSSKTRSLATSSGAAARAATVDAERQADLVTGEDQRLTQAEAASRPNPRDPAVRPRPYRVSSPGFYTLVLTQRRDPYTFDDLRKLASDTLVPQPGGSFLLREHILVAEGATLAISPRKPLVIKMTSGPDGFVSLVTDGGRLQLFGTAAAPITFESWDESHGKQDRKVSDGRAYIRASGQLVARHTAFSRLGFWSGRTGGVSVVGGGSALLGQDLVASTNADAAAEPAGKGGSSRTQVLPAGKLPGSPKGPGGGSFATQISDSSMTGNAFGLFITGSSGPKITDTVIRRSLVDGLVLHRNVDSALVSSVQVEQSGSDGVVISRDVEGTVLTRLNVRQNGRDGIVLAGRPLAEGPSASGSSTRAFGNNVLTASQSVDNLRNGVHVIGGTAVRVQGNTVSGGRSGIVVSDGASDVSLDSNRVAGVATNGIQVRESQQITLTGNSVHDSPTGFHLRNSIGALRDNSTSGVTLHGITFVGRVAGSVVDRNFLTGSGTSAIDIVRVADHQEPTLERNDLTGWSRTVTSDSLLSVLLHPLTVIWMVIALALLLMSRPRRAARRLPYGVDPLSQNGIISIPDPQSAPTAPEPAVFVIPERPAATPSPAPQPVRPPQQAPPTAPTPVPVTPTPRLPRAPRPRSTVKWTPRSTPGQAPISPGAAPVGPGHAVIDLAIRESRVSPVVPRRRRVIGR